MYLSLVPIRVGMILDSRFCGVVRYPCPHTRGDDPIAVILRKAK